ncbi:hypothetical protein [Variovorax sp. OV329]|uniref:beta strand repeat-containing protein n=1 Tax=Variovorax sp. OV329 TaxID=1882825 RepID=UPI0008EB59B5|nr:hypothetical protein [Variovorax sp. OV329]SFM16789.1 Coiled stalk of trimeric autotransporter adhesin [Variovorax sp. OV329]
MEFKSHKIRSWSAQAQAESSAFKVPHRRTRLAMGIQASIMALGIVAMADDALAGPAGGYSVGAFDSGVNGANTDTGSCLYSGSPGIVSTVTSSTGPCTSGGGGRQAGLVAWTPTGGFGAYMLVRSTDQIAFGAGGVEKFRIMNTGLVALDAMNMSSNKITSLAAGTVSSSSTDAINGSQLHGVASNTAAALGGGASVDPTTGAWTAPSYPVGGTSVNNVGAALTNLDGRVAGNTAGVASNSTAISNLVNGSSGLVQQNAATRNITVGAATDGTQVSIAGTGGNRVLTGVAAGAVSATSVDAINGSQLQGSAASVASALGGGSAIQPNGTVSAPTYTVGGSTVNSVGAAISNVDGRVTQNTSNIAGNTSAINNLANGTTGLVQQNATTRNITVGAATDGTQVSLAGTAGNRVLTGVAAGAVSATSVDAINGSQLQGTAASVANALGGGSAVQPNGTVSAPSYSVGGSTVNNVGAAVSNLDGRTSTNSSNIAQNTSDIAGNTSAISNLTNGTTGLVQQNATTRNITVGAATDGTQVSLAGTAGNRVLTGVAAGAVSTTSVDAINGSQLQGSAASVASALGGGSAVQPNGTVSPPSYSVGGSTVTNVGAAVTNLDGRTTTNSSNIRAEHQRHRRQHQCDQQSEHGHRQRHDRPGAAGRNDPQHRRGRGHRWHAGQPRRHRRQPRAHWRGGRRGLRDQR